MKLNKCLKITKTKKFEVYVYPKGHIKYNRGIEEALIDTFDICRDSKGNIIQSEKLEQYKDYKVTEIIQFSSCIGLVIE